MPKRPFVTSAQLRDAAHERVNDAGEPMTKVAAKKLTDAFMDDIRGHLVNGTDVRLAGIGTLRVDKRTARANNFGQPNPNAGKTVVTVKFRGSSDLLLLLNDKNDVDNPPF